MPQKPHQKKSKPRSRRRTRDPWLVFVDRCTSEVYALQLTKKEHVHREEFTRFVMKCVSDAGGKPSQFGSIVHNTDTIFSDVDIAVDIRGKSGRRRLDRDTIIKHLNKIAGRVRKLAVFDPNKGRDVFFKVTTVFHARVPLVKILDPVYEWEADISVLSSSAHHESIDFMCHLIQDYDPRVREFLILLKTWTKRRKVNDSRTGKMNSFGFVVMGLKTLQEIDPPILPAIEIDQQTRDWRFVRPVNEHTPYNESSLADLLYQFFSMFANFDYATKIVSLDTIGFDKKRMHSFPELKRNQCTFIVKDPVNYSHNLAKNVRETTAEFLREEFARGVRILENNPDWDVLMREVNERDVPTVEFAHRSFRSDIEKISLHLANAMWEMKREQVMTPETSNDEKDDEEDLQLDNEHKEQHQDGEIFCTETESEPTDERNFFVLSPTSAHGKQSAATS